MNLVGTVCSEPWTNTRLSESEVTRNKRWIKNRDAAVEPVARTIPSQPFNDGFAVLF